MPLTQQAEKGVSVLAEEIGLDSPGELDSYSTVQGITRRCLEHRRSLRASLSNTTPQDEPMSVENYNNPVQAGLIMAQTLQAVKVWVILPSVNHSQ